MSAVTASAAYRPTRSGGRRAVDVARLHLANPMTLIGTPLIVLGVIQVVTVAVTVVLRIAAGPHDRADFSWSGAAWYLPVYMLVIAIQSMNQTFAFAQGLSVTRRDYYRGTLLVFAGLAVAYTLLGTVMGAIESATHGYGLEAYLFAARVLGPDALTRLVLTFAGFVFALGLGTVFGGIFLRFRALGVLLLSAALVLVLIGIVVLISVANGWPSVGDFLTTISFVGAGGIIALLGAIAACVGWLLIRRATATA